MAKKRSTIRDNFRESRIFTNRAIIAIVFSFLLLAALTARLVYLQILSHEHYSTLSQNNRVNIKPIAPMRGLIYDRNGVLLAENIPTFSLELVPERIKNMDETLKQLSRLVNISPYDLKRFRKELKRKKSFTSIPLRLRLTDEEIARFSVNRFKFDGVDIIPRLSRRYPQGELASHVIGYVGRISESDLKKLDNTKYRGSTHTGKVGIEKEYEDLLHGQPGFQEVETNAGGRVLRVLNTTPPVPGKNLYLNIDVRLQRVAETAFGEENGALIAMDPNTGEVLAMVSKPTYDPNLFVDGIDYDTYNALNTSINRPLYNRAVSGTYPPGSTIKPFMTLAGLENKHIDRNFKINCKGHYIHKGIDRQLYRDWKKGGHGITDLNKAIAESCDVFFYDLAYRMGIDEMSEFMNLFGFGQRTNIDLPGESRGLMPNREWKKKVKGIRWYPGESMLVGIGQGYMLSTPLQLATATSALATRGIVHRPLLLRATSVEEENPQLEYRQPEVIRQIELDNSNYWLWVHYGMVQVVHGKHGTARGIHWGLKRKNLYIAGKTGTAQVYRQDGDYDAEEIDKRLRDHALFISYAPARNPSIVIAVLVENGGHGSSAAAPVARKVFDTYAKDYLQ
jgi:penicillin-binding protein 2